MWAVLAVVFFYVVGCGETQEVGPSGVLRAAPPAPGIQAEDQTCAASDEAFVRRLVVSLWGRRALSNHEIEALLVIATEQGREALVDAMLKSPEVVGAWSSWLNDWLYFNRAGERANAECFQSPLRSGDTGEVARWIRDYDPTVPYPDGPFTLVDLLTSTVHLDDLSPIIRVQPFLQVASWVIQADNPEHELATRRLYARIFESQVLHRRLECLTCHNSAWSVTDGETLADDRSWPASGHVESAVFGADTGLDPNRVAALFRIRDVMSLELRENTQDLWYRAEGLQPWGMAPGCGQFSLPDELAVDWLGASGYLVEDFGESSSIYDLEGLLHRAFDGARGEPLDFTEGGPRMVRPR